MLGLGEPISTKTTAAHGVVTGDSYDSHIQEYYYQQEGMIKEQPNNIGNLIVIGAVVLSGVYLLKKMKGK